MIRTRKAAQAWVEDQGVVVGKSLFHAQGNWFQAKHPEYPALTAYGRTYLEAINNLLDGIDEERASDARARESEIPW